MLRGPGAIAITTGSSVEAKPPDRENQRASLQDAESPTELKTTELTPVKENPVLMAESPPEVVPSSVPTAEQPLRRSGRITSRPKLLNGYVLC